MYFVHYFFIIFRQMRIMTEFVHTKYKVRTDSDSLSLCLSLCLSKYRCPPRVQRPATANFWRLHSPVAALMVASPQGHHHNREEMDKGAGGPSPSPPSACAAEAHSPAFVPPSHAKKTVARGPLLLTPAGT